MANVVPPEAWEEVKTLLAEGRNAQEIARMVKPKYGGPSGGTIRAYRREHPELRRVSPEDVEAAKEVAPPPGPAQWDEAEWTKRATEFLSQHVPLPGIPKHIAAVRKEEMGFETPQTAVALFSDYHLGSKIDPRVSGGLAEYSTDIARRRLARWRDTLLRFTQMNQLAVTVDDLVLFALGDELEGHGKMFGTQAFQMDQTAFFQYMVFITDMEEIILSMLNRYKTVTIFKVYGNHGRMATGWKDWYGPDNMEMMAWEHLGDRLRATTGGDWSYSKNGTHLLTGGRVNLCISRSWFVMADIQGWLFYARHGHGIGDLKRTYCVTPEMRVLTRDLRWVPAGDLKTGDALLTVDKEAGTYDDSGRTRRRFRDAQAIVHGRKGADIYEVELADGRILRCNGEHTWLTRNAQGSTTWHSTNEMYSYYQDESKGGATRAPWKIMSIPTWDDPLGYDDGRIAGALEADGCLTVGHIDHRGEPCSPVVSFAQQENELLVGMRNLLTARGFRFSELPHQSPTSGGTVFYLRILGGLRETMRLLGSIRPPRLLAKWLNGVDIGLRDMVATPVAVVDVRRAGWGAVVLLETTAGTYITEGAINLNTGAYDHKLRMNSITGRIINYMVKGHLHEAQNVEAEIGGSIIQNGSFVGPSMLTLERNAAVANIPSQEFYLLHPKYGLTHHHRIHLATAEEMRQFEIFQAQGGELMTPNTGLPPGEDVS